MPKFSNKLLDNCLGGITWCCWPGSKTPAAPGLCPKPYQKRMVAYVLNIHIETRLLEHSGTAVTNFDASLPWPQSDLAWESLKDPYRLDFLGLGKEAGEREIENALVKHVTEFLLELGAGFAFGGRQVLLDAGGDGRYVH